MSYHTFSPIVMDNLVYYVDFLNEKSYDGVSTFCLDLVNSDNGTFSGSPTINQKSLSFDGVVDYINFGSLSQLQFTNTDPYSISVWFKWTTNSTTTIQNLFGYAASGGTGYYITLDTTGAIGIDVILSDYYDGSNYRGLNSNSPIPKDEWCNIVVTSDSSNSSSGMKIYLNGEVMTCSTRGFGSPNSVNYSGIDVNIAARMSSDYFEGDISTIMVYSKELTDTEVNQNYNATKNRHS